MACVFIDFKSAYNTISKNKLYQILNNKAILNEDEIKFLKVLYGNTYF